MFLMELMTSYEHLKQCDRIYTKQKNKEGLTDLTVVTFFK